MPFLLPGERKKGECDVYTPYPGFWQLSTTCIGTTSTNWRTPWLTVCPPYRARAYTFVLLPCFCQSQTSWRPNDIPNRCPVCTIQWPLSWWSNRCFLSSHERFLLMPKEDRWTLLRRPHPTSHACVSSHSLTAAGLKICCRSLLPWLEMRRISHICNTMMVFNRAKSL